MRERSTLIACMLGVIIAAIAPATVPAPQRDAELVYQSFCGSCHSTGWNGAPISGIKDDWTPRLDNGFDAVFQNAKQGINTMPPMGTCTDCSDTELKAAIELMLKF
jgi:cytochrome c5